MENRYRRRVGKSKELIQEQGGEEYRINIGAGWGRVFIN